MVGHHLNDIIGSLTRPEKTAALASELGWTVGNLDATVQAQRPRLALHIPEMIERIASALGVDKTRVSVKATTTEGLGFTGRGEGIAAHAVVLLEAAPE